MDRYAASARSSFWFGLALLGSHPSLDSSSGHSIYCRCAALLYAFSESENG